MALYEYTKDSAFPEQLSAEIEANETIITTLDYVYFTEPESLKIMFVSALSGAEETALTSVVGSHTPSPTIVPEGYVLQSDGSGYYYWDALSTLSGTMPTYNWQLAPKEYIDTISGTLQTQIDDTPDTKVFDFAVRDASKEYFEVNATQWTVVISFPFPGTDSADASLFSVVGSRLGEIGHGECKLFDYTNNNDIALISWNPEEKGVYESADLVNLPSGPALFEVQVRKDTGNASKVRLHSCVLR